MRALAILALLAVASPVAADPILISEVLADPAGSDEGAVFVELFGPAYAGLDGYVLVARNGSGGGVTHRVALDGLTFPESGFLVIADAVDGKTTVPDARMLVEDMNLQNGPDSLQLLRGSTIVDALAYGTFGEGHLRFGEGQPIPTGGSGSSVARVYANLDTEDNLTDFEVLAEPTPGWGRVQRPADDPPPPSPADPVSTPEPGTVVLAMAGAVLALMTARRRR